MRVRGVRPDNKAATERFSKMMMNLLESAPVGCEKAGRSLRALARKIKQQRTRDLAAHKTGEEKQ